MIIMRLYKVYKILLYIYIKKPNHKGNVTLEKAQYL